MKTQIEIPIVNNSKHHIQVGEVISFIKEYNPASTGYTWRLQPDNLGIYELIEELFIPSVDSGVGRPGKAIWKVQGVKVGEGSILFELYPPGETSSVETITIILAVD